MDEISIYDMTTCLMIGDVPFLERSCGCITQEKRAWCRKRGYGDLRLPSHSLPGGCNCECPNRYSTPTPQHYTTYHQPHNYATTTMLGCLCVSLANNDNFGNIDTTTLDLYDPLGNYLDIKDIKVPSFQETQRIVCIV